MNKGKHNLGINLNKNVHNTQPQTVNLTRNKIRNTDRFLYLRIPDVIGSRKNFRCFINFICGASVAFKL